MRFNKAFGFILAVFGLVSAVQADELRIVTTLPTYASIAQAIGGERVSVTSVASARFNPHFIEPRPSDVLRLKRADLFINSGLDLEAWRQPLVDASGNADVRSGGAKELNLSSSIALLNVPNGQLSRAQGDIHLYGNPHYWMNPQNGLIIAEEIAKKLSQIDPSGGDLYSANLEKFRANLTARIATWIKDAAPLKGAKLIGYHDEWVYLMTFLGLSMEQFLEPKPGIPPTPKQVEFLKNYIQEHKVRAIIQPTYYSTDAAQELSGQTGAAVLKLCQNVGELENCGDYLAMLEYDISSIFRALHG